MIILLISSTGLGKQSLTAAEVLRNEVGFLLEKEKFRWVGSRQFSKDYTKFQNPFFSAIYPKKCFSLLPNGGGDEISDSLGLVFERTRSCGGDKKGTENKNWLAVRLTNEYSEKDSVAEKIMRGSAVYKSLGTINGRSAAILLLASMDSLGGTGQVVASIKAYVHCKGTHYVFDTSFEPGQTSIDIIRSRKFEIPKDFKDIISSFECTGKNVI
ncbi:hypothetical protein [Bdellovibrio bacteriovorus]|uniref:hypothetical protein n=1 Tax=Bdellovibrio bacteriovorus TaxID=959 RepID=UPI00130E45E5|nr:hypothetical protein [Bdellovibrio bacteriovorus]